MANINNRLEYINELAEIDPQLLIERSETRYKNIISDISKKVSEDVGREIIMLAGPSASGKTTTANKLAKSFTELGMKTYVVSLDDFYLDRDDLPFDEEGQHDYETVFALDLPLIAKTLNSLVRGEATRLPVFDFKCGKRSDEFNEIMLDKNDAIIVEGLHALNPIITEDLPNDRLLKIYISVSSRIYDENGKIILNKRNIRFIRRMVRDYKFRASSVANTYELWDGVRSGEDKYLFPYKKNADMTINSIHLSEPCVFNDIAIKMLSEADLNPDRAADAQKLLFSLRKIKSIPSTLVPKESLLREFLGND
ncbi:MAG: nucleoside kinase [Oscillospiraceae bacterium]